MIYRICADCGSEADFSFDKPMNLSCQRCGSPFIKFDKEVNLKCYSCDAPEQFIPANKIFLSMCSSCKKMIWIIDTSGGEIVIEGRVPLPEPNLIKIVIPYYDGGPNIQRAVKSWVDPNVVFALNDKGIIPPGSGICSQFYTEVSANDFLEEEQGRERVNLPMLKDLLRKLMELHPHQKYYGYFNSDIILPPGKPLTHLLPQANKLAVMHHRIEVKGSAEAKMRDLKIGNIIVVGKDGFIFKREVAEAILEEYPDAENPQLDMVLGRPFWDTSLAIYLWHKYGWDRIDFAYREIWHVSHKSGSQALSEYDLPGGKWNHKQSKKIFKTDYNGNIWKDVCDKSLESRSKVKRPKIGIIQPGRVGDIILCLPIAKWYYYRGYEVVWPVHKSFIELFDRAYYVHPLILDCTLAKSYLAAYAAVKDCDKVIDLGIGFGRAEEDWYASGLRFDEWKYREAGVPLAEKYNLQIERNFEAEQALKRKLNLDRYCDGYVVTHSESSFARYDFNVPDAIEVKPTAGFHLFDWIGVLEGARYILCVDSCVANLVNQLGIGKGRRYIKTWHNIRQGADADRRTPELHAWEKHSPVCTGGYCCPQYMDDNNAMSHIVNRASKWCEGNGIDLGGGANPFPGAECLDLKDGDLEEADLKYANLDYIFSSHFLEHLQQPQRMLERCYKMLKEGGVLFLYLPHPDNKNWHPDAPGMGGKYGHKHILEPAEVIRWLEGIGFELAEATREPDHYYSYYVVAQKPTANKLKRKQSAGLTFTAIVMAFNSVPFMKPLLDMMREWFDEIIVIEGCIEDLFSHYSLLSDDGTHQYLQEHADEIVHLYPGRFPWKSKQAMQNTALLQATSDYIWLIDSDEFYREKDFAKIRKVIERKKPDQVSFPIHNFFKSFRYVQTSAEEKFQKLTANVRRIFRRVDGAKFINHRPPTLDCYPQKVIEGSYWKKKGVYIYHFPYIFEKQVKMKCLLYERQLKEDHEGIWRWYNDFFLKWEPQSRKRLEGNPYGVWYPDRTSRTKHFRGVLPKYLKSIVSDRRVKWES